MAEWNTNPSYTELKDIMLEQATRQIGLTAEQFNKVMENIQYLKNLYGLYKCSIGTISVIYAAPGTAFDVDIVHRQETEAGELVDYLDFKFTVAVSRITTTASSASVDAKSPAKATVTPKKLDDNSGYNFDFNFEIPKGEIGDAICSSSSATGNVSYTLIHDTDKTFTSTSITKLTISIPNTVFHGFFAGVNFPIGSTPPALVITNKSSLPLKLMKRGTKVDEYTFTPGKTVMFVVSCDGINVYCNLIEV